MMGCVSGLIALACIVFTAGLIAPGAAGSKLRTWSVGLFAAALMTSVIAVILRDLWARMTNSPWPGLSGVLTLIVLSIVAFAILELRRYVTTPRTAGSRRIVEKRPVSPRSANDNAASFLRDWLKSDESEEQRRE